MLQESFRKAINEIYNKLERTSIKWALVGSTNLSLQGMDIKPRDLDIVVRLEDLSKIKHLFSEYNPSDLTELKPLTNKQDWIKESAWEVKLHINGIEVQILGQNNSGEYISKLLKNRLVFVEIDNIKVPCFTLEAEKDAYTETNRAHKSEMIGKFLAKHK